MRRPTAVAEALVTRPDRRDREFIFGSTSCYVSIRTPPPSTGSATEIADVFIVEEEGRALRRIANSRGAPRRFNAAGVDEALALAALYLERHFGPLRDARVPAPEYRPVRPVREPPMRRAD